MKGARINVTNAEPKDEKGGKSSRSSRGPSRSSSRRHNDHFDFKDMREVMYSPRSGIQQPYTSSRRSPPRGGEVLDSRSNMQFPPSGGNHPQTSYNDYRTYSTPAPYGAPPPDMRPPSYPTHTHTQQYDARDLQYGAYWSTSK